jgi:hypothetical protein
MSANPYEPPREADYDFPDDANDRVTQRFILMNIAIACLIVVTLLLSVASR